jgi:hypothetical protein
MKLRLIVTDNCGHLHEQTYFLLVSYALCSGRPLPGEILADDSGGREELRVFPAAVAGEQASRLAASEAMTPTSR